MIQTMHGDNFICIKPSNAVSVNVSNRQLLFETVNGLTSCQDLNFTLLTDFN